MHASYELLTTLLREELGFEGVAVSDWQDIEKLNSYHHVAATMEEVFRSSLLPLSSLHSFLLFFFFFYNLYLIFFVSFFLSLLCRRLTLEFQLDSICPW